MCLFAEKLFDIMTEPPFLLKCASFVGLPLTLLLKSFWIWELFNVCLVPIKLIANKAVLIENNLPLIAGKTTE